MPVDVEDRRRRMQRIPYALRGHPPIMPVLDSTKLSKARVSRRQIPGTKTSLCHALQRAEDAIGTSIQVLLLPRQMYGNGLIEG